MDPTDPGALPPLDGPDPNAPPDATQPKPWHKQPQPPTNEDGSPVVVDAAGTGNLIDAGVDVTSGALDAAGSVADAAGSALEGAGSALEAAGGCLDGCGGCSLALLVTLFAATGTAMALFR
jgi:hypothetical protein